MNNLPEPSVNRLPVIPEPPHDPTYLLLNGIVGWRDAELSNTEEAFEGSGLILKPAAGSGRELSEESGSFGGLILPGNVARGPDGSIYLLDRKSNVLKRFDPCECLFQPVPCMGGAVHGPGQINGKACWKGEKKSGAAGLSPRQFSAPHGIGICDGNIYVCDTGNHRLSVFALHGMVFRASWMPPPAAGLHTLWEPFAVAFDGRGRVFVSDRANECIHRFSPSGYWQTCFRGFGKVSHLAIDCRDFLYAAGEGDEEGVTIIDGDGKPVDTVSRPGAVAAHFPRLPFYVDAHGNLHLRELCTNDQKNGDECMKSSPLKGIFDLQGNPVKSLPVPEQRIFEKEGRYISEALDSRLYRCQWHRVVLRGSVPMGTTLKVLSYTAETLQPESQVLSLQDVEWETDQIAHQMEEGEYDCLIRSGGGRYLWLQVQFRGNGLSSPGVESIQIEFPRISMGRNLPAVFGAGPESADFTDRFLGIFDTVFRSIEKKIDNLASYFDPMSTPARNGSGNGIDFLSWLASWIGITFDRSWPVRKRRLFLKKASRLFHIRGTREGLRQQLIFFLGMEGDEICCDSGRTRSSCAQSMDSASSERCYSDWQPPPLILEHYQLRRWLFLGSGRLGDQAVLWGKRVVNRSQLDEGARLDVTKLNNTRDPYRDPFHVYAHKFSVFVPVSYGKCVQSGRSLENLISSEKPAHTQHQLIYVEPRFRIGFQSMIGLDAVVGRYPEDVVLDDAHLGQGSVLGSSPSEKGGPSFEVGREARVGFTTKLD